MGYRSCKQGEHGECNGYVGVHDTYVCHCGCHGEFGPDGRRALAESIKQMRRGEGAVLISRPTEEN